jgi:hypothetical protein
VEIRQKEVRGERSAKARRKRSVAGCSCAVCRVGSKAQTIERECTNVEVLPYSGAGGASITVIGEGQR